ncbi:hypothetical protein Tco_0071855 [Tanacetum coccineum]
MSIDVLYPASYGSHFLTYVSVSFLNLLTSQPKRYGGGEGTDNGPPTSNVLPGGGTQEALLAVTGAALSESDKDSNSGVRCK